MWSCCNPRALPADTAELDDRYGPAGLSVQFRARR